MFANDIWGDVKNRTLYIDVMQYTSLRQVVILDDLYSYYPEYSKYDFDDIRITCANDVVITNDDCFIVHR